MTGFVRLMVWSHNLHDAKLLWQLLADFKIILFLYAVLPCLSTHLLFSARNKKAEPQSFYSSSRPAQARSLISPDNEGDTNPVEKIACDNVMRATSVLRSVGEKSTGKVPNIAIFQPFVATVGNSAITECKFLDIGQKKGGKEKAKQVSSALGSFPSFYIAILLAVSPLLLLHPHLIGIHHYYPSLPKASLSVQPPYSSLYAEFP